MSKIFNKTIKYKDWTFKSNLEYEFCLFLEQLQESGFIERFGYEEIKFELSPSVYSFYYEQLKTKIKEKEEFLMRENTYQPDFYIDWVRNPNLFYLERNIPITCNISDIPFRVSKTFRDCLRSYIEVKPLYEEKLDSSKEFPLIQKQLYQDKAIFVQKIKPEKLFKQTFVPDKLIASNVYQKKSKFGVKGDSKYRFDIKTLQEYLKLRGYGEIG